MIDDIIAKEIFLRRPNMRGVQVEMAVYSWGPNGHLMISNNDQTLWFSLSGNIDDLATTLRRLANKADALRLK